MAILNDTSKDSPETLALKAQLAKMQAENDALKLKAATRQKVTLKISEKGGLSAYGMGRFPVTLYKEQWLRLLAEKDMIMAFIKANEVSLKTKE